MPFDSVIFDFDYTLVDSSRGVHDCSNFALERLGLPPVTYERSCRTIGLSLPRVLVELAGPEHAEKGQDFVRFFVARADEVMAAACLVYPGVPALLGSLSERYRLGIVSTKYRYRIQEVLDREGLARYVNVIVGGEDVPEHKPDPAGLLEALRSLGASAARTLYVGDSLVDAEAAHRAGLSFAAVLSGTTERHAFRDFAPVVVLDDLSELPAWLANGLERPR